MRYWYKRLLILWWNCWKNNSETLTHWWVILNYDDQLIIENLENDVTELPCDSLDDDFTVERIMKLIAWLLNILIMWTLCILSCLFESDSYVDMKHWLSFTIDKKNQRKMVSSRNDKNAKERWFWQSVTKSQRKIILMNTWSM